MDHDKAATGRPALCPAPVAARRQNRAVRATARLMPDKATARQAAWHFLFQVILPPSGRWGFISVGKNASTSTLKLLYQAEFGHALSADAKPDHDINPEAAVHMLAEHGVFTRALWQGLAARDLTGSGGPAERLAIVREPLARAVSGFRYIGKSHRARSQWFARDRFRMDAVVGFDWDSHPDTADGFRRFLDYIAWQIDRDGADAVDAHWQPQATFIKPDIFKPTLQGRMEEMDVFYASLADRLGFALPEGGSWSNRQSSGTAPFAPDAAAIRQVREIYAEDYERFGY
ncbi:sulfotransferase family 2 domain-containing protein [Mesobacterium pallidum]|uniref:sulfotransferase family 2 domain-containing protein n=1 Tax=Mesobacterium pallidum TaxID=2872037 RepID=UPI001EE1B2F5|nr:sulfotransferase family 2 domain-containing protein [Mesobacterium pallidum]